MVGAAQRILDLAVEHAKTRVQSGRPIGAFQAIQHACADLVRGVESARPLVLHAAWRAQEGLPCETDVAMAKSYAGDACLAVARKAHQVFGAIGYCDEHPLHRLHKQIIAARLAYGDTRHHAETIARAIGLGPSRDVLDNAPGGQWLLTERRQRAAVSRRGGIAGRCGRDGAGEPDRPRRPWR